MIDFNNMENDIFILIALIAVIFIAISLFYLEVIAPIIDERAYIKMKMRCSSSKEEYDYWQWELRRVYLRHIPIIGRFFED